MSADKAPRVFVTYSHDSPEHKDQVLRFATVLRARLGLDVHLDQWYDNKRRDWSLWAIEHLRDADYVLVIASPDYKRRADGVAAPNEGRGAQFEAAMLRDALTRDLRAETGRILPVVLPGRSIADIPTFLNAYSTTRYEITDITDAGVADLVAAITGIGRQTMPKRGPWPHTNRTHVPLADAHLPLVDAQVPPADAQAPLTEGHVPPTDAQVPLAGAHVPLSGGPQSPVLSSGLHREPVRLDGVEYPDSIVFRPTSAQSRGFVDVDLSGAYARLAAVVGVPDDAADAFQVGQFLVYVDGHLRSDVRAAPGKPVTVEVDVTGASHLRLEMFRPAAGVSPLHPPPHTRPPTQPHAPHTRQQPSPLTPREPSPTPLARQEQPHPPPAQQQEQPHPPPMSTSQQQQPTPPQPLATPQRSLANGGQPLRPSTLGDHSGRLPELAWGAPTLW